MKLNSIFTLLALSVVLFTTSCSDDDSPKTIAQLAADTDDLSTLVAALERAELTSVLDGSAAYTVFAPTNAAFQGFLDINNFTSLEDVPVDALKDVLLNHVVSGTTLSSALTTGYLESNSTTPISIKPVNLYVSTESGVNINGQSSVTTADIAASNGVVHIVNSVIVPATIATFATADPTFGSLAAALTREADFTFVETLSGSGQFTVFAPTNAAFDAAFDELGLTALDQIPTDLLSSVLSYHVVSGANVLASSLTDGQTVSTILPGASFEIDLDNGPQIIDGRGRMTNIVVTDVQAVNGVVHAVDRVLLPTE